MNRENLLKLVAEAREKDKRPDLSRANLSGANLSGADLSGANLRGAINIPDYALAITIITPGGDFIGWKKLQQNRIAKLLIPAAAKRSNATGRKCRSEFATVLAIYDGEKEVDSGLSQFAKGFIYLVGETVHCDDWDDDRWNECSGGIHFFLTRYEAENY